MSILGTFIVIVVAIMVVMTAVAEPQLSFQYGKAVLKSGKNLYGIAKPIAQNTLQAIASNAETIPNNRTSEVINLNGQ